VEPRRDNDGAVVQWYGASVDIDDEMRAQQALRDRERELAQLVDMLPGYVRRLDPEGEPIFFNKRLTDFIGMDLAEIGTPGVGRLRPAVEDFVHPDDAATLLAAVRHGVATGEGYAMKYRMRRADGVYRWIDTRAEPIWNQDGTIAQWYVISIDIDDEVRAQEALQQASDKLAKATQAASLAELSASIAHEVNQPLAAVVFNSHACHRWLSAEPPNVERAKLTVERITRDANGAAEVVSRIRALFKQSVVPRHPTTFHSVIAEARNLMTEEAARHRIRMDVAVESDLPPIALDRVQIQQVLINLMRNGMDAMDAVNNDRVLDIRVRRMGNVIQSEISDRGRGVEFPDKIFEPFFTTKCQGMGMGLAICRSIIESHGGRLWTERNEPCGATFIFTLPVETKTAT
jgi:PAS domain S-box-containing protein